MKKSSNKITVSERAVIARINRRLAKDGTQLRKARTPQMQADVGNFYTVDIRRNFVSSHDVDIIALAKKLGVLRGWEQVQ